MRTKTLDKMLSSWLNATECNVVNFIINEKCKRSEFRLIKLFLGTVFHHNVIQINAIEVKIYLLFNKQVENKELGFKCLKHVVDNTVC